MRIEPCGFKRAAILESPEDQVLVAPVKEVSERNASSSSSSSSTSSIGRNSDQSWEREGSEENEAQSAYNIGPLDMMDSLEQVLPIRRGISKFYNGKSKSYTSLAEASSCSSIKDMAKPENGWSRRRRNLMAYHNARRSNGGGISKRPISSSRTTLALAVAMNGSSSVSDSTTASEDSNSRSPPSALPPLHPQGRLGRNTSTLWPTAHSFSPWRSFSVADLHYCATAATTEIKIFGSSINEACPKTLT